MICYASKQNCNYASFHSSSSFAYFSENKFEYNIYNF